MSSPRFEPWLIPETIRSGRSPTSPRSAKRTQSTGVPSVAYAISPSSSSTSSTESGDLVVMLRAVALRFESGTITCASTPSTSASACRRAWSPSAPIPSSFVSKTRISEQTAFALGPKPLPFGASRSQSILGVASGHNQGMQEPPEVLTVGHSTHPTDRLVKLLRAHRVELVGDVRRFSGSRRHPQFNADVLARTLGDAGIAYEQLGDEL